MKHWNRTLIRGRILKQEYLSQIIIHDHEVAEVASR